MRYVVFMLVLLAACAPRLEPPPAPMPTMETVRAGVPVIIAFGIGIIVGIIMAFAMMALSEKE